MLENLHKHIKNLKKKKITRMKSNQQCKQKGETSFPREKKGATK